jgi:predicted RNase H-like HicB family nuclease
LARRSQAACLPPQLPYTKRMRQTYTAVIKQSDGWWIGWIEEVPGVNGQGKTREELIEDLRAALIDMLAIYRERAREAAQGSYTEEEIAV